MTASKTFLLDSNVFIEAHRRYYAFDLCPGFWECLEWQHRRGRVRSIDRVKQELERERDELRNWIKSAIPREFFCSTQDGAIAALFGEMVAWVEGERQYMPQARSEFATSADGWLIATAKQRGWVLVTHERQAPLAKKTVPIPNVCDRFEVPYVDTFEMLRDLEARFGWKTPP